MLIPPVCYRICRGLLNMDYWLEDTDGTPSLHAVPPIEMTPIECAARLPRDWDTNSYDSNEFCVRISRALSDESAKIADEKHELAIAHEHGRKR